LTCVKKFGGQAEQSAAAGAALKLPGWQGAQEVDLA